MRQVALFFLFLLIFPIRAQMPIVPYTAKTNGAIQRIMQEMEEKGYQNFEINGVITVSGSFEFQNIPITLAFDLEDGTAPLWIYAVSGEKDGQDSLFFLPIVQVPFLGFQVINIQQVPLPQLPVDITEPLDSGWIDSDIMLQYLNQDGVYQLFRQAYPDSLPDLVWIAKTVVPIPRTSWNLQWVGSDLATSLWCRVDALTGETVCVSIPISTIPQWEEQKPVSIYPNPAHDLLIVRVSQRSAGSVHFSLFTAIGQQVQNLLVHRNGHHLEEWILNVSHLPRGVYSLVIQTPEQVYHIPLVLN